jgi:sugar transferase (PEP-CTERM system associated)
VKRQAGRDYLPVVSNRQTVCGLVEFVLLVLAFVAAVGIRFHDDPSGRPFDHNLLWLKAVINALILQVCIYYTDLYEDSAMRRRIEVLLRFAQAFFFGTLILTLVYYVAPPLEVGRGILLIFLPLSLAALLLWRSAFVWVVGREVLSDSVLILGTGQAAQHVVLEIQRREPWGFRVAGFIGQHAAEVGKRLVNPTVIGTVEDMPSLLALHRINLIVVALEDRRGTMPVHELLRARLEGVRVEEATNFLERLTGKIVLKNLRPSWLVFSHGFNKPRLFRSSKRAVELMVAALLVGLAAPLMLIVALLVRVDSGGPVLYRQERVGEKGRVFPLFKFRTMRQDAEAGTGPVWASKDGDPRITRVGRFLRKTRLDELPQLLNVLRGEMAFVGPRPERPHFVENLRKVIPYYDERHSVKPGITGWAQIKFGYGSTIEDAEEKLQYDLYYIKHMSLIFDLGIVVDTLKVVVVGKGAR